MSGSLAARQNESCVPLAASLIVLMIAQPSGEPRAASFEKAAKTVVGDGGNVELVFLTRDPPDDETAARGRGVDGVVELSWSADGSTARLHCFLTGEQRWVDREISFGSPAASAREAQERGRLVGFAAAGMFSDSAAPAPEHAAAEARRTSIARRASSIAKKEDARPTAAEPHRRLLEFAGVASAGVGGTASGVGAAAGFRWRFADAWWARAFVAGRTGNIPVAQASTRLVELGGGVAWSFWDAPRSPCVFGVRVDAFASYFEASHLSEDDVVPDRQSRWLPGMATFLEGGFRFTAGAGVFVAGGAEGLFGKTDVYTHGNRVAVVPALRLVGELGFRAGF